MDFADPQFWAQTILDSGPNVNDKMEKHGWRR